MLDYGTVDNHTNKMQWADNANWDSMTTHSMAMWVRRQVNTGATRYLFNKAAAGNNGWIIGLHAVTTNIPTLGHGDGTSFAFVSSNTALTLDTVQSLIVTWTGSNANWFLNNVADGTPAFTKAIANSADGLSIGAQASGTTLGAAASMGHCCLWRNYQLTAAERGRYQDGGEMPNVANLVFWCRGLLGTTGEPDEMNPATGTETGTVVLRTDPVDGYYVTGGALSMFIGGIFLPFMMASAKLLGQNLMSEAPKVKRFLDGRCWMDLRKWELRELLQQYRQRPSFAF